MVRVKICGITSLEDALAAAKGGSDALGFIFYRKSPRYIAPEKAKRIINGLPEKLIKIGVFVNAKEKTIKRIAKSCNLDILQFHGDESPEFCQRFKGFRIIKAFRVKDKLDLAEILRYKTFAYLFDAFVKSKPGGTGKRFNWELARRTGNIKRALFLSGGLNDRNIKEAIRLVRPDWVDVVSSVEASLGKKDYKKVNQFIQIAKGSG